MSRATIQNHRRDTLIGLFATIVLACFFATNALAQTATSPYEGIDWSIINQYKASLHVHTSNSDAGAANTLSSVLEYLYAHGYDIVAITDHIQSNQAPPQGLNSGHWPNNVTHDWWTTANGITYARYLQMEAGDGRDGNGMLMIPETGEQSAQTPDEALQHGGWRHVGTYFANYNAAVGEDVDDILQEVENQGGLSIINHAARYSVNYQRYTNSFDSAYDPDEINQHVNWFLDYSTCVGMEIINRPDMDSVVDRVLWDNILKQTIPLGRNVWGFSNDDSHSNGSQAYNGVNTGNSPIGVSYNMFLMPTLDLADFRTAMESGNFYAVAKAARYELGWTFGYTDRRWDVPAPYITDIAADGSSLTIIADNYTKIEWISEGKVIATGSTIDLSSLDVGCYVRANIIGPGGIAFTQPIVTESHLPIVIPGGTYLDSVFQSDASYLTNSTDRTAVIVDSQHLVDGYWHDAYVMNNANIDDATVLLGTLAHGGTVLGVPVVVGTITNATVSGRGELINYVGGTVGTVTINNGGYVTNDGTITTANVNGGGILYNHRSGACDDTRDSDGTIGTATVSGTGWLNNTGGTVGTVTVAANATGTRGNLDNNGGGTITTVTMEGGTLYNYGVNHATNVRSTIAHLTMNNGTVYNGGANSSSGGAGGLISTLTYYGGTYFDHADSKFNNNDLGYGTIGTLNLAGDSTGIDWGTVTNLNFDSNGDGIIGIAGSYDGITSGYSGINVTTNVNFTDGNIVLDLSDVDGIGDVYWTNDFFDAFGYSTGFNLSDLFGYSTFSGVEDLYSFCVTWNGESFWILDDGVFGTGWSINDSTGFVSWNGTIDDPVVLTWTGTQTGQIWDVNTSTNWRGTTVDGVHLNKFLNSNTILFDNTALATNRNVTVASSGVTVGSMEVTGTGYTFNMTIGSSPAITATGTINFGNAVLNITGYTTGDVYPSTTPITVIDTAGGITGFNPAITISNQSTVDYLSVKGFLADSDHKLNVTTELRWYSTDPSRKAFGDFTLLSGNSFTLGVILTDNDDSSNRESGWSGDTLTKKGAGTLILTQNNEYTGLTTVAEGTLQLGNGGTRGTVAGNISIANDANVTFYRANDIIFSNIISGAGSLTKKGGGTLTLTGYSKDYFGTTTVEEGKLLVGDSATPWAKIAGAVDVLSGAMLGGYGTISGHVTLESGATLSPGGSIGDFYVDSITFKNGSTYLVEIDKDAHSWDRLFVDGDVIILAGAKLDVQFLTGSSKVGDEFRIIVADESQFHGQKFTPALFLLPRTWGTKFEQEIRSDGYYIMWEPTTPEFAKAIRGFGTPNAINAAKGMDAIYDSGQISNIGTLYDVLSNKDANDPQGLANAFAQLHGEVFASSKEAAAQMQRRFQRLLPTGRDLFTVGDLPKKCNLWGTITGDWNARKHIGQYSGYKLSSVGVAVGADRAITTNILVGVALGYDNTNQNFRSIHSHAQIDAFRTMVYGSWFNGDLYCDAYGGYTKNQYKTSREINIDNVFTTTARSRYKDDLASVGLDFGRTMWVGGLLFTPSMGVHYIHLGSPGATETDGGDARLHVASGNYQSLRSPVGLKVGLPSMGHDGIAWIPEVRAFYVREWADDSARVHTSFDGVRDVSFTADSGQWGRNSGRLGAGLGVRFMDHANLRLDYDYEVYNHTNLSEFSVTLGVNW